jgi:hypothetical protein
MIMYSTESGMDIEVAEHLHLISSLKKLILCWIAFKQEELLNLGLQGMLQSIGEIHRFTQCIYRTGCINV